MRISDWSSDVCSSDLAPPTAPVERATDVHLDGHVVYAGFWKRVAVTLCDVVIIALLGGVVGAVIGGLMGAAFGIGGDLDGGSLAAVELVVQLVSLVLSACYYGWFYASANQATPGKMAIGIKVVRSDGPGCGFWRGFARYFASLLSAILLCIGYLMVAFTELKPALPAMTADTLVAAQWHFTAHT